MENTSIILSDLDGTLFRDDKSISDFTKETIRQAQAKGLLFGICTSRAKVNAVKFLGEALKDISKICESKKRTIPWYVLTGGAETEVADSINDERLKWDADWTNSKNRTYYSKNTDTEDLFHRIKYHAHKSPRIQIQEFYRIVFEAIEECGIDDEAYNALEDLLVPIHFPDIIDDKDYNDKFEKAREILEYIFRSMSEHGLLPDWGKQINLQWSSCILAGKPALNKKGVTVIQSNKRILPEAMVKMVKTMAKDPIIFALANPVPEISYEDAMEARPDTLMSTGRTDYPNQINNVIGFPYIFRGALDVHATAINEEMKMAAVHAIADLAKLPVPDVVNDVYKVNNLKFGREYFIPKPVDPRLISEVSAAVAKAAIESGVARKTIDDWESYKNSLSVLLGQETKLTQKLYATASAHPQRVVFAEGIHPTMLRAAVQAKAEGICQPILLGNDERIAKLAKELDLSLEGIEVVNLRHDNEAERRERFARILTQKRQRDGYTFEEANDKMFERNYFGMMMVETGEADAFITGLYTKYSNTIKVAKEVIGIRSEYKHFGTMHIINSPKGTLFLADTLINNNPNTEELVDLAKLSSTAVRFFNEKPVIAMVSHSNFGSDTSEGSKKVRKAVAELQTSNPEMIVDGEIQIGFALNREQRDSLYPFTRLKDKDVNTLVFPNLTSARSSYKMLQALAPDVEIIGPIQMGLNKPIHFTDFGSSVRDVVNITAVAVIDAYVDKIKSRINKA